MIFGDEQIFSVNCVEIGNAEVDEMFVRVSLRIARQQLGDAREISAAGAIINSAKVFLKYAGSRQVAISDHGAIFEYLQSTMYGDNWRTGVSGQFRARFAVHEIFDVSVSDQGWLVFLVDTTPSEALVLVGRRDKGYLDSQVVPGGNVEQVLIDFLGWLQRH